MLDPRDWKAILEVYAGEPALALALAYQFNALKQFLQRGAKGIPDAVAACNQAIQTLYLHTDFHELGQRLYYLTIESTITVKEEELITALTKSVHDSKRKPMAHSAVKQKPQISLVKPIAKSKPAKKRRAS